MRNEIETYALSQMNHTISTYNVTGHNTSTEAWNLIQSDVSNIYLY
jgi:hypothetical protein